MQYLSATDIVATNVCLQQTYGQMATIRDAQALDYIVKSAQQEAFGRQLYATPAALATFYFIKLIKKHVFNDGNKRTAYLCLLESLQANGVAVTLDAPQRRALADLAIHVAQVEGEPESLWQTVAAKLAALGLAS